MAAFRDWRELGSCRDAPHPHSKRMHFWSITVTPAHVRKQETQAPSEQHDCPHGTLGSECPLVLTERNWAPDWKKAKANDCAWKVSL